MNEKLFDGLKTGLNETIYQSLTNERGKIEIGQLKLWLLEILQVIKTKNGKIPVLKGIFYSDEDDIFPGQFGVSTQTEEYLENLEKRNSFLSQQIKDLQKHLELKSLSAPGGDRTTDTLNGSPRKLNLHVRSPSGKFQGNLLLRQSNESLNSLAQSSTASARTVVSSRRGLKITANLINS
jgi:cell division protein FtsB